MSVNRFFYTGVIVAGVTLGTAGGFVAAKAFMAPVVPVWVVPALVCIIAGLAALALFAFVYKKRHRADFHDEFAVRKKSESAQLGLSLGILMFLTVHLSLIFIPGLEEAVSHAMHRFGNPFEAGRMVGFLPVVAGVLIARLATAVKYS
ncbi:hypothetical protein [Asticcacaulis excentricus]|uniref:Uncharacterized protein n=1 Tax=Asticcacaulis excentricus (strain ATCC 15261 / DSM 4724 / KCTC 12464 / NCIMB 9791 / VKM B-1370 / CB 48) TaxID=573065 RepID=E8RQU7_ASTEC|nr:hypothetical protein [Asticcacaulis excentricus]ADU12210.1 hypothetical protein Astex_0516 [Asticcacaulis excentricus CB 48]